MKPSPAARIALAAIRLYQYFLSPFFGRQCRFHPTCSVYAAEAILRFGVLKGTWLAVRRLLRCFPWHPGGLDPVPNQPAPGTSSSVQSR